MPRTPVVRAGNRRRAKDSRVTEAHGAPRGQARSTQDHGTPKDQHLSRQVDLEVHLSTRASRTEDSTAQGNTASQGLVRRLHSPVTEVRHYRPVALAVFHNNPVTEVRHNRQAASGVRTWACRCRNQ